MLGVGLEVVGPVWIPGFALLIPGVGGAQVPVAGVGQERSFDLFAIEHEPQQDTEPAGEQDEEDDADADDVAVTQVGTPEGGWGCYEG